MSTPTTEMASPVRAGETVATYDSYEKAQRAVDYLSDNGFPVENTQIVGSDLHLVEQVTGRVTTASATLAGAGATRWRTRRRQHWPTRLASPLAQPSAR